MDQPDYDKVAPFYDQLAELIFGKAISRSRVSLARSVPPGSSILIAGGGTGQILSDISALHKSGLNITYIEMSKKMLALSKARPIANNHVTFMHQSIQNVSLVSAFDIVFTPFFLDNFSDETIAPVFDKLHAALKPNGLWLFSDFQNNKSFWQKVLLKVMYAFFRLTCHIEASQLPDTSSLFNRYRYTTLSKQTFYKDFICSTVYKKPGF